MILYFAGESWDDTLADEGVKRRLLSFAAINQIDKVSAVIPEIFLDSGAFSAFTGKANITVESYSLWLQMNLEKYPQIKVYAALDAIGDSIGTQKNLEYMEAQGLEPLPVYHYGEPTEVLNKLCTNYDYVALGGLASKRMGQEKLRLFWEWVSQEYPDTRFHAFGIGVFNVFSKFQPYSVDTTLWVTATRFHCIAGYREKKPHYFHLGIDNGFHLFFNSEELIRNNIRAMLDWEKLEWLNDVPVDDPEQPRLL